MAISMHRFLIPLQEFDKSKFIRRNSKRRQLVY